MSLFRLILYIILFFILYNLVKKVFHFLFHPSNEIQGKPRKKIKHFDPDEIEDIDYEEVDRKKNNQ